MMNSTTRLSRHLVDRAIKIKRTLAVRSRILDWWGRFLRKAMRNRFGLEIPRDVYLDWTYGGWCGGIVRPTRPDLDSRVTQSVHYWELKKIFRKVPIQESDVLVDVGCGKGRVLNYWLEMGCRNQLVGVELNERVAQWTRSRLKAYPNVNIISGSILEYTPLDGSLFFLYNPFGETVMAQFKAILEEATRNGIDLRVIYHNCVHRNLFDHDPGWDVRDLDSELVFKTLLMQVKSKGGS